MRKLIWTEKNKVGLCINNPVRHGNKHISDINEQDKQQGNLNWLVSISSVTSMQRDSKKNRNGSLRMIFLSVFQPPQSFGLWDLCKDQTICTFWWNVASLQESKTWFKEAGIRVYSNDIDKIYLTYDKIRSILKSYLWSTHGKTLRVQKNKGLKGISYLFSSAQEQIFTVPLKTPSVSQRY